MGVSLNSRVKTPGVARRYLGVSVLQPSMARLYRCEVFECRPTVGSHRAACYWQASQASGFSSEQAMASSGLNTLAGAALLTVVLAILVAGRERR